MSDKILLVEDSKSIRAVLEDLLKKQGYSVKTAENGKIAFDILQSENFDLMVTDLEMPVMDGRELIDLSNTLPERPIIIVLTSIDKSEHIIDIMKKSVYDYLIKPVKKNDLVLRIEKGIEYGKLKRIKNIGEKEKLIRLENQLEWYKFLERKKASNEVSDKNQLFENLQRSLNQGSGYGTLVSLIDIFTVTAKKKGNIYEVDEFIIDQIIKNKTAVEKAGEVFGDIEKVSLNELTLEEESFGKIYDIVEELVKNDHEIIDIENNKVILSQKKDFYDNIKVNINVKYVQKIVKELLLNAVKYSPENKSIIIMFGNEENNVYISFLNEIKKNESGIPTEYENIIFEPFFRIVKYVQEKYLTLDYGLGLTLAEKIMERHNGKISLFNVKDYSEIKDNPVPRVNCRITFPIGKIKK